MIKKKNKLKIKNFFNIFFIFSSFLKKYKNKKITKIIPSSEKKGPEIKSKGKIEIIIKLIFSKLVLALYV